MQYEYQKIEEAFKRLPTGLQHVLSSTDVTNDVKNISTENGLMLDQETVLFDIISYTILGFIKGKDFISNLTREGIDQKVANKIATSVNEQIFSKIRVEMQRVAELNSIEEPTVSISSLETAGNFTIEPEEGSNAVNQQNMATETHADIIAGIENPASIPQAPKKQPETRTEPLIDALLSGPVVAIEQKSQVKQPAQPSAPQPKKQSGPDLYRESVE